MFKAGLSSLSDGWAKYKQKLPDMSDSNQNLETTAIPNSSFQNFKIFSSKGYQRSSQKRIMYS